VALQQIVEETVAGLGYELVEIERSAGGLLRITIDNPWQEGVDRFEIPFVTVEDCEKVNRQLMFALEVDGVEYRRLEVSSPGIDITLKAPMGEAAAGLVNALLKKFRGTLEKAETGEGWQIVWSDAPEPKPGARVSKKRPPVPMQVLGFTLDELREARLAPVVDFKGRKPKTDIGEK
jgi:ribosome maturation factor RimP